MVTTERHIVIGTLADAGCTHTSYCCAITKTLVAVGSAASSMAENTQVGEKLPIQLGTP